MHSEEAQPSTHRVPPRGKKFLLGSSARDVVSSSGELRMKALPMAAPTRSQALEEIVDFAMPDWEGRSVSGCLDGYPIAVVYFSQSMRRDAG